MTSYPLICRKLLPSVSSLIKADGNTHRANTITKNKTKESRHDFTKDTAVKAAVRK